MANPPSNFCIVQSLDGTGIFRSVNGTAPTYRDPYDAKFPPRIFMSPSLARRALTKWCEANDEPESNWEIIPVTIERRG